MVTISEIAQDLAQHRHREYTCATHLNLYEAPGSNRLVTQAAVGRQLYPVELHWIGRDTPAVAVCLCEDGYPGWLNGKELDMLSPAAPYRPIALTRDLIAPRLASVIGFTQKAMACPNQYLWGGTIGPDFDCSGLMQTAFASVGVRLPRDAYQQEAFTTAISIDCLEIGDLLFFGDPERTTHVALYLGDGQYIHSSGNDYGRNGIGIDSLWDLSDPVSRIYARLIKGVGRVMGSYKPQPFQK